jgi:hypothetical protein
VYVYQGGKEDGHQYYIQGWIREGAIDATRGASGSNA